MRLDQKGSKSAPTRTLVSLTGKRERISLRYLDSFKEVAVLQATGSEILYINHMETITDSRGSQKGIP